ncbi:M20 family metallopeptidase [Metabacillus arenae]|uniref:Amidohydrolase n=1 Tax=Metabacillus arenae TaxID=2771434 RepID=A0A926NI14_9BACI|nr:M20 family metallopeptidase [Metabacillus arenae]MBD1381701.1 amidohydrolase [Metabacillus arenae]
MKNHEYLSGIIEEKKERLLEVSNQIWGFCETRYEEFQSAELLCKALEEEGFKVEREAGNIKTAFIGTYGSGGPTIAILGEFDALPNLSQEAGTSIKKEISKGGNGHGCGHHLLGVGSLAAAIAVRHYIEKKGIEATIRYYGCPAEEGGGGKAYMVREGLFKDVDIAFTWHPYDQNIAYNATMLATTQIYYKFKGISNHASFAPHLGRSALDAVELMNVGVNYLREHIIPEARVHYAITNTGGFAPNIVQAEAEVLYKIRAPKVNQVKEIVERVTNIAKGASLMTETEMDLEVDGSSADLIPNVTLASLLYENFKNIGVPGYTEEELKFAQSIQNSFSEPQKENVRIHDNTIISNEIQPFLEEADFLPASTDVGDVSWNVPTGQVYTSSFAFGTPIHSWQLVTQGKSSIAHKGMLLAGKVMAASAVDAILRPELIEKAKNELKQRTAGNNYVSLIPSYAKPLPIRK